MPNDPGLSEIATTTLRNRKMPSKSVKQAKTMSAIAHGWKPTGEAADIPVSVAKEFHAADKGKKYGAKKKSPSVGKGESKGNVDRSAHYKGNPGFYGSRCASSQHGLTTGGGPNKSLKMSGIVGAHRIGSKKR